MGEIIARIAENLKEDERATLHDFGQATQNGVALPVRGPAPLPSGFLQYGLHGGDLVAVLTPFGKKVLHALKSAKTKAA